MNEMRLYKILQNHVGVVNALAAKLYQEKISKEEALEKAAAEIEKTSAELKKDKG